MCKEAVRCSSINHARNTVKACVCVNILNRGVFQRLRALMAQPLQFVRCQIGEGLPLLSEQSCARRGEGLKSKREEHYALDYLRYSSSSVAARFDRQCRRRVDSPSVSCRGDSADHQPGQRSSNCCLRIDKYSNFVNGQARSNLKQSNLRVGPSFMPIASALFVVRFRCC